MRWLLAVWRVTRGLTNTQEAAIVEIGFSRSRLGRRFAGWQQVADGLRRSPETAAALAARRRLGPIDLETLGALPPGSLGEVFATHCRHRGIDPNLVDVPVACEADFVMAHLFEVHDVWHVVTGWGNDELGEIGLGGVYLAQLSLPLIALMLALILLNTVFRRPGALKERMEALVSGYEMGRDAAPLFGIRWDQKWGEPIHEVRRELRISTVATTGEGIRAAA